MASNVTVPIFAVLGVVNECKTSLVAVLTADPTSQPNPIPGATNVCRAYPFRVEGQEVFRLYDTPGFQNAARALAWCREQEGQSPPVGDLLAAFRAAHEGDPDFRNEVELFRLVVEKRAPILYVVDGSSPVTATYRAEMELLWRSARPRMALINHKDEDADFTDDWKRELSRYFDQTKRFNVDRATLVDRLELLRDLRHIDERPEWRAGFDHAIAAVEGVRNLRRREAVLAIQNLLARAVRHRARENSVDTEGLPATLVRTVDTYQEDLRRFEREAHERLRDICAYVADLESSEAVRVDLFHASTWQTFGLTRWQLVGVAATLGAQAGGPADALLMFRPLLAGAVIRAVVGAARALLADRRRGEVKIAVNRLPGVGRWMPRSGVKLDGRQVEAACHDPNLLFVLLDRVMLLYRILVRRAHAQRGAIRLKQGNERDASITRGWTTERHRRAAVYLDSLKGRVWWTEARRAKIEKDFWSELELALRELD